MGRGVLALFIYCSSFLFARLLSHSGYTEEGGCVIANQLYTQAARNLLLVWTSGFCGMMLFQKCMLTFSAIYFEA